MLMRIKNSRTVLASGCFNGKKYKASNAWEICTINILETKFKCYENNQGI